MSTNDFQNLFSNETSEVSTTIHLLPEFKKVDFFLKIDNSGEAINFSEIQQKLNTIESIAAIYAVDINKIKSKKSAVAIAELTMACLSTRIIFGTPVEPDVFISK